MRLLMILLFALLLTSCASAQPYTSEDLQQVREGYAIILPVYIGFRQAYLSGDGPAIMHLFQQEQRDCKLVDIIDARDSIDPNTQLFQASAGLDNFCNDIESAYAQWAKAHHRPYDRSINPATPQEEFKGTDLYLKKEQAYLKHPAAFG